MSYKLNKTNGELLVDLVDGQIDNTSTDITLVGRNYKGFGEFLNENFIKLMENFAKTSAPGAPLVGQLWYDTAEERLKIYTGETFRAASGAVIGQTQPNLVAGDLWIDSLNNKLYFFDGEDIVLVGPQYTAAQGKTGFEAFTVIDENGQDQTVLYMYVNGTLTAIVSRTQFRPKVNITGFPVDPDDNRNPKRQLIKVGLNPVSTDFRFRGTAESTSSLIDNNTLEAFTSDNFMKTDRNTQTSGSLKIKNAAGLSVGVSDTEYVVLKVTEGLVTALETQRSDRDFAIRTRRGNAFDNAFYVDSSEKRVGIFTDAPSVDFDVEGDARVTGNFEVEGNLQVNGDTTYLNVSSLRVEDKNIELGLLDDSTQGTDAQVDGAGIIVRSSDGSKDFTWEFETGNWTSNQSFDLTEGNVYKINNVTKLSANRLDDSVIYAEGLVRVGTLQTLTVDSVTINDSTITSTGPLNIGSTGDITINNQNIVGVLPPNVASSDDTVATKGYVDQQIDSEPVVLTTDCTGFSNPSANFNIDGGPYNDVIGILNFLYPASEKENGTVARVYATSYSGTTVTGIDIDNSINKSYVSVYVDPEDSTTPQLESVLQDVNFAPITGDANLVPSRATMEFEVNGNSWQWVRTTPIT
jgi:hypothetical protein